MRANEQGLSSLEFRKLQEVPVEAVDASGCAINYQGLDNLCEWGGGGEVETDQALPFRGGLQKGCQCHPPSAPCSGPEGAPVPVAAALSPRG